MKDKPGVAAFVVVAAGAVWGGASWPVAGAADGLFPPDSTADAGGAWAGASWPDGRMPAPLPLLL